MANWRRWLPWGIGAAAAMLLVAWPIETFAHHQPGPWPEAFQVSAALVLIGVTVLYVRRTGENVALQREQMERAERQIVVIAPSRDWFDGEARAAEVATILAEPDAKSLATRPRLELDWADTITVKNIGPGVAVNVRVHLGLGPPSGVSIETV